MGYYTWFSWHSEKPNRQVKEEMEKFDIFQYESIEDFTENDGIHAKWYSFEENMITLSEKFPYLLFEVHGEGEDYGDKWKAYFKNGKSAIITGRIVYDDFNEEMLK